MEKKFQEIKLFQLKSSAFWFMFHFRKIIKEESKKTF